MNYEFKGSEASWIISTLHTKHANEVTSMAASLKSGNSDSVHSRHLVLAFDEEMKHSQVDGEETEDKKGIHVYRAGNLKVSLNSERGSIRFALLSDDDEVDAVQGNFSTGQVSLGSNLITIEDILENEVFDS